MGLGGGRRVETPNAEEIFRQQAFWNRPTQIGPYGGLVWDEDRQNATSYVNPAILDQQQRQLGMQNAAWDTLMGWYGAQPAYFGPGVNAPAGQVQNPFAGGGGRLIPQGSFPGTKEQPLYDFPQGPLGGPDFGGGVGGGGGFVLPPAAEVQQDMFAGAHGGGLLGPAGPYQGLPLNLSSLEGFGLGYGGGEGGGRGGAGAWGFGGGGFGGGGGGWSKGYQGLGDLAPGTPEGYASQLDLAALGDMPTADEATRSRVEQALFERQKGLLDPTFDLRRQREAEMLANRGIVEGSDLWKEYSGLTERDYGNAVSNAMLDAITGGGQEMALQHGLQMQGRQQGLGEQQAQLQATNLARQLAMQDALAEGRLGLQSQGQLLGHSAQMAGIGAQMAQAQMANALRQRGQEWAETLGRRQQLYNEQMGQRGQQFGELASILGFQGPQQGMGGYWGPGQVDVPGAYNVSNQAAMLQHQMSPWGQLLGLGGMLGGAALGGFF